MEKLFNCTQCGLCCTKIGLALDGIRHMVEHGNEDPIYLEAIKFPYATDETGRCSQLLENNLCAVYENRPRICNIRSFHNQFFPSKPLDEFYKEQEVFCKKLQDDNSRNP